MTCCTVVHAVVVPVQNANVVKITDFGLAKLLDVEQDVFKAAGGKVCHVKCFKYISISYLYL